MKKTALALALLLLLTGCRGNSGKPSEEESFNEEVIESQAETSDPSESSLPPDSANDTQPEPEVDNTWQTDAPENHGMNSEILENMHDRLASAPVYAVVTAKDGVIVDEYYAEGYDENSAFPFHSASKSFTGALIGIAIDEGYIGGVDDLLSDYLPQVADFTDGKEKITLRHLLTHTSGIEWYEWGGGYSNWEEFRSQDNWVDYILGRNMVYEPGTVFNYSTGNTHLLSAALEAAIGKSQVEYANEKLFEPLGMTTAQWGTDPQGIADGGNGLVLSCRDAARFGQLCLNGGVWHDRRLIPADWLTQSTSVQNNGAGDNTGSYGFQWWIRQFNGYDCYFAFGAFGQYIFVVPELDLVVAIASTGPQDSYASRDYFTDYILPACE